MPLGGDHKNPENEGDRTFNYGEGATGSTIEDKLSQIFEEITRINRRIDFFESKPESSPSHVRPPTHPRASENHLDSLNQPIQGSIGSIPIGEQHSKVHPDEDFFKDIQQEFNSLKSSVEKVVLPAHLKLHDSRSGIKREDQPVLTVVSKCGRYVETALKLLSEIREGEQVDLNPISTTLIANLKYLQDEYAALLVNGRFDRNTSQLFRSLQSNNSGFSAQCLQNVRVAAELSSISSRNNPQSHYRGSGRGYFGGRGRGRDNRDVFQSLQRPPRFNKPWQNPPNQGNFPKDQEDN